MRRRSLIYDGWLTRYKVNRVLDDYEVQNRIDRSTALNLPPIDKGLVKVNSVFVECVDRYFFLRGWAAMGGSLVASVCLAFMIFFGFDLYLVLYGDLVLSSFQVEFAIGMTLVLGIFFIVIFLLMLIKDFFCFTYYPIRFNRLNRKVYIFKNNSANGVLTLGWDEVFWFVGRSRDGSHDIYDLRGHVLDDEKIVRYTFAVGQYGETQAEILQHWETIRLYMEESPAALPYPPLALSLSTQPTLRNCLLIQMAWLNGGQSFAVFLLSVVWGFFRWLALITCRQPRWPADVEAACQIPVNDPYRQTEPLRAGEFLHFSEADERRQSEYMQEARAAAEAYENARSKLAAD